MIPKIEKRIEDIPGFDFKLPCPVADFLPEFLFASNSPRDGIRSIDNPTFSAATDVTWLEETDRVLGVVFEGDPLAIPVRILVWHEVVNVTGSRGNAAVTYCPLTFTGITLDLRAQFPGQTQTMGVSGLLYNSNLVLYDRQTESLWTQMSGSAYAGGTSGACLDLIPTIDTTFGFWKSLHPDTKVLDRPGKPTEWVRYDLNPYLGYWESDEILYPTPVPLDMRLGSKEWVLGVLTDKGTKAYPVLSTPVVNDSLPGIPFVVFSNRLAGTLVAYKAWLIDGERLWFSFTGVVNGVPRYEDDRTGSTWTYDGRCVGGPLSGQALERMPSYLAFYFAWWSYFPHTEVHAE